MAGGLCGVGGLDGVLGLAGVLHHGNIAAVSVNGVGHGLETTVGQGNVVLAVGVSTVTGLLVSEVVVAVVVLHGILPGVQGISLRDKQNHAKELYIQLILRKRY